MRQFDVVTASPGGTVICASETFVKPDTVVELVDDQARHYRAKVISCDRGDWIKSFRLPGWGYWQYNVKLEVESEI